MRNEDFVKGQLALLAWREGNVYGGVNNALAVAFIVRNRVRAGWHGGDWLDVIADYPIHSATMESESQDFPSLRDPIFREILSKIDYIYDGSQPDKMTEGALYLADLNKVNRPWFKDEIIAKNDLHKRVGQVGSVYLFT